MRHTVRCVHFNPCKQGSSQMGRAAGNGKKDHRHLRAVGQDYRYFVIAMNSERVEVSHDHMGLYEQTCVGHRSTLRRQDRG